MTNMEMREIEKALIIINNIKKMCREKTKEINRIYHGGFSSREQSNFDGQLEIMREIMKMTDRRRKA
jgi:hypothetical protein